MVITKGTENYMILDINPMEMSNIYDAFQNAHVQMTQILAMDDTTFMQYLNVEKNDVLDLRKIIKQKIEFYKIFKEKILTYATSTKRAVKKPKK